MLVGRQSFPFGVRRKTSGAIIVSGRVVNDSLVCKERFCSETQPHVENKTFDAILKHCLFNTKPITRHNETKPNKHKQTETNFTQHMLYHIKEETRNSTNTTSTSFIPNFPQPTQHLSPQPYPLKKKKKQYYA